MSVSHWLTQWGIGTMPITGNLKEYLRIHARHFIDDDDYSEAVYFWEAMSQDERSVANTIIEAVFGEYL